MLIGNLKPVNTHLNRKSRTAPRARNFITETAFIMLPNPDRTPCNAPALCPGVPDPASAGSRRR